MPIFEYKGLDQSGKFLKGNIESESLQAAKIQLKDKGVFLQEIQSKGQGQDQKDASLLSKKVKTKSLAVFTRLLSTLLRSNIPLVEALEAVAEQTQEAYFSSCITDIKDQVNEGKPFHIALKSYPNIFDTVFVSLCESGEASGNLDEIFEQLALLMEKRSSIKSKVGAALVYPGILLLVTVIIMVVLCTYVIPTVSELFEEQGDLPWMTNVTIGLSELLINYWISLLIGLLVASFLFLKWKKSQGGKKIWDRFVLTFPALGRLLRASDISLFSRTLSTLLHGGVPVLQALDIVKNVVKNELIKQSIQTARENIKEGESIAAPLRRSGQFPPVVLQMIRIGEKTGELEKMLRQISDTYDRQVEVEVTAFTALLGPVMLIVMACIIGFVLVSVMMPMLGAFGDIA